MNDDQRTLKIIEVREALCKLHQQILLHPLVTEKVAEIKEGPGYTYFKFIYSGSTYQLITIDSLYEIALADEHKILLNDIKSIQSLFKYLNK